MMQPGGDLGLRVLILIYGLGLLSAGIGLGWIAAVAHHCWHDLRQTWWLNEN